MIRSFSIIVPAYNCEQVIVRTLESIEASLAFFYKHADPDRQTASEIIVINDGSGDGTAQVVEDFIRGKPNYQFINHFKSLGAGPARNAGVKVSGGEVIFFMDGDDLFFPEHVYVCLQLLNHQPGSGGSRQLPIPDSNPPRSLNLPDLAIGIVKTGIRTADPLHPYWKSAIENGAPINLCLRRECHEFLEGYPEASVYKQVGREDIAYYVWMLKFFKVFKVELETVEYIRYPHNNLTRQLKKFQTPPEQCPPEEISEADRPLHLIANKLEEEKLTYLYQKLGHLPPDRLPIVWMQWPQLAQEFLNRQQYAEAIRLLEAGIETDPVPIPQTRYSLAVAYNNLGSTYHKQGDLAQASAHFLKALATYPEFTGPELARVSFNLGTVLKSQQHLEQAQTYLQKAVELEPGLTQAHQELTLVKYQLQVQQRGYQFSQDWFSINLPLWETALQPLMHKAELRLLEVGSWEGRSACWFLDNLLTHPTARLTCIDTFAGSIEHQTMVEPEVLQTLEQRFDQNLARTGASQKVRKLVGRSQEILRSLPLRAFDLVYLDGSHLAKDVLTDGILSWDLVKVGGLLIFDDYDFQFPQNPTQNPKIAIDALLAAFGSAVKILHQGHQVLLEKLKE